MTTTPQQHVAHNAGSLSYLLPTIMIGFVLAAAPIKFGSILSSSSVAFYPVDGNAWLYAPWPAFLFPVFGGVALLLVLGSGNRQTIFCRDGTVFLAPMVLFVAVSVIGMVRTTEIDFARLFLRYMVGLLAFVIATFLHCSRFPCARRTFIRCIIGGTVWSLLSGWYQVLFGFEENVKMAFELAEKSGQVLPHALVERLVQKRVYGSFTYPNIYAAHMLLCVPLVLVVAWRWGRTIEPVQWSPWIISVPAAGLFGGIIVHTGSRGALVGAAVAMAAVIVIGCVFNRRIRPALRAAACGAIVAVVVASAVVIAGMGQERGLSSMFARLQYYRGAIVMTAANPVLGVGMGEFYPWYMRVKKAEHEETRLVHNLFLHFLSQCGVLGGLVAVVFLFQPLVVWWRWRQGEFGASPAALVHAGTLGFLAWAVHSMFDFNLRVPGTMAVCVVLPFLCVDFSAPRRARMVWQHMLLLALAAGCLTALWRCAGERAYQDLQERAGWGISTRMLPVLGADSLYRYAKTAGELLPWSPYPYELLGKVALNEQKYEIAERAFAEASRRTPHRSAFHALRAEALLELGEFDAAATAVESALEWYPEKVQYQELEQLVKAREKPNKLRK